MDITMRKVSELHPYEKNAKKHPSEQVERIANSLKQFGWVQPVVVDENDVIVIGHGRVLAAKKLGMKECPVVKVDTLTEEQVKALRLADNKLNESEWDFELLNAELEGLASFGMEDFGFEKELEESFQEEKYTQKANIPQYEPTGKSVGIEQLVDNSKCESLLEEIEGSNAPDEIKNILRLAATRHLRFNYTNIAEYYAQADKNVQELMEHSALVIIDLNDAIANGFTVLNESIEEIMNGDSDE